MISISVQATIYSDIIKGMQTDNAPWTAPTGPFYLLNNVVVPFSPNPTVLAIETDRVGEAITIEVDQIGDYGSGTDIRKKIKYTTIVTTSTLTTAGVQLGQGRNLITASVINRPLDIAYLIVNATTIVALWEAFARVLYAKSTSIINEQTQAIYSTLGTRLAEPFISFQNLLPNSQSLKPLAMRMATKGLIHSVGTSLGVTELIKSLSFSTPIYHPMDKDTFDLYPALDPWTKSASQFGGQEAHIWLPNLEIASWISFLCFINNQPDIYEILSISETEVVIMYQGQLQIHYFDFNRVGSDTLSAQATTQCFNSIIINATMISSQILSMCAAAYTFDLFITSSNLLGDCRPALDDLTVPFDSNCPLDTDAIDPFTDGWIDLSLTGRFEQDYPQQYSLDTFVMPSSAYPNLCTYTSWYTQLVKNQRYDIDVLVPTITVNGYIQEALVWILQSPDSNLWQVSVNHLTKTLMTTLVITSVPTSNFKVIKPDSTQAAFAVTDQGVLQVIPIVGTEELMPTLYIASDDQSAVWWVTVNNNNVLVIDQIFPV